LSIRTDSYWQMKVLGSEQQWCANGTEHGSGIRVETA
jgi:hypothetical protein